MNDNDSVAVRAAVRAALIARWAPHDSDGHTLSGPWAEGWVAAAGVVAGVAAHHDGVCVLDQIGYDKGVFVALTADAEAVGAVLNQVEHQAGDTSPGPVGRRSVITPDPAALGTLEPSRQRSARDSVAYLVATIDHSLASGPSPDHGEIVWHIRAHLAALSERLDDEF